MAKDSKDLGIIYVLTHDEESKKDLVTIDQTGLDERMPPYKEMYSCRVPYVDIWRNAISDAFAPYHHGGNTFEVEFKQMAAILMALSQTFDPTESGVPFAHSEETLARIDRAETMLKNLETAISNLVPERETKHLGGGNGGYRTREGVTSSRENSLLRQQSQIDKIKEMLQQFRQEFNQLSASIKSGALAGEQVIEDQPVPPAQKIHNTGTGRKQRESLSFDDMGIPNDSELLFNGKEDVSVRTAKGHLRRYRKVKDNFGKEVSFNKITKELVKPSSNTIDSNLHWKYKGKLLRKIFNECHYRRKGKI